VKLGIVKLDEDLLFALTLTLGLASRSGEEVLLLASDGLALREFLGGTLIGFAHVLGSERKLLLGHLGEVRSVRLGLVLGFRLRSVGIFASFCGDTVFLLVLLGDGFAGLLVGPFLAASLASPAVGDLLFMITGDC
jgi:hypothetical protein